MATWWVSTLGNDGNTGASYAQAKRTLAGIMGISGLVTGDTVNVVRDGIHTWPNHTSRAIAKPTVLGTDFGPGFGLLIRGTDEYGNPGKTIIKAFSADGTVARSWLAYEADTVGWYIFRNFIFDATEVTAQTQTCRILFWNCPGNVSRPTKFEGCELWGGPLGSTHNGNRWLIDSGGFAGAATRLMSAVSGGYFQNCKTLGDFYGNHSQQWDHFVVYYDVATNPPGFISLDIGTGSAAITDLVQDFHNYTMYVKVPSGITYATSASIVNTRPNIGVHTQQNNLFYQDRTTSGTVNNPLMRCNVAEPTSIVVTRNIGGNVILFGPNITSFVGALGYYENLWDEDRNDGTGNDPWTTDTVALNQQEADVFANPNATYAWDSIGNGVQIVLPKDLRPIKYLTSGLSGSTPGALPAFVPVDADFLRVVPEIPVKEIWEWLTSIITSYNGSAEQRMALRMQPRRSLEFDLFLEDESKRREEYRRLYASVAGKLRVPFHQYGTHITQSSLIGATKVFFDPAKTDVRNFESVIVHRRSTGVSFVIPLNTVVADGATTLLPLVQDILVNDLVMPSALAFLENKSTLRMITTSGGFKISALAPDARISFPRPGSTAVINAFDGLNILDRTPIVRGDVPESFDFQPVIFDNETGIYDAQSHWAHAFIDGVRRFLIKRYTSPGEMDYWRDFLHAVRGMREPFLFSTFREDLVLAAIPGSSDSTIDVLTADYDDEYFPNDTYKRFRFEAPDGSVIYRKINSVLVLTGTTQRLTLNTALPGTGSWGSGFKISFLNRVRLGSDQVVLTHDIISTVLELVIRTTDT